jgi:NAD+ synthase (glutamine-hydrolysing)
MSNSNGCFGRLLTAIVAAVVTCFSARTTEDHNDLRVLKQQLEEKEKEHEKLLSFLEKNLDDIDKLIESIKDNSGENKEDYGGLSAAHKDSLGPTITDDKLVGELKKLLFEYRSKDTFIHKEHIFKTIRSIIDYYGRFNKNTPVIGISGGIDSLTVFLQCCLAQKYVIEANLTNHPLHPSKGGKIAAIRMPINSNPGVMEKSKQIIASVKAHFPECNIVDFTVDQSITWRITMKNMNKQLKEKGFKPITFSQNISKSSYRTWVLYYFASSLNGLVMGTGNKNEDGFIFFFSVPGDGRVDYATIWSLTKKQVYEIAYILGGGFIDLWSLIPTADLGEQGKNGELLHTDADEVGCGYDSIELIQRIMTEEFPIEGMTIEKYLLTLSPKAQAQYEIIHKRVMSVHKRNSFKANLNPVLACDPKDSRDRKQKDHDIQDFDYSIISKSLVFDKISNNFMSAAKEA